MKDKMWADEKQVKCIEINGNIFLNFDEKIAHSIIHGHPTFVEIEKGEFHRISLFMKSQELMFFSISEEMFSKDEVLKIQNNHIQSLKGGAKNEV